MNLIFKKSLIVVGNVSALFTLIACSTPVRKNAREPSADGPAQITGWTERSDFSQRLEPKGDHVLTGGGYYGNEMLHGNDELRSMVAGYFAFTSAVSPSARPALVMWYSDLSKFSGNLSWLVGGIQQEDGQTTLPQIGIGLMGDPSVADGQYISQVASGQHDSDIQALGQFLIKLNHPALVRIGYEFNGSWNGYKASDYVLAFQRIVSMLRAQGVDQIAFVWCTSINATAPYMKYYPGDAYVDWWGIDLNIPDFSNMSRSDQFISDAVAHQKPVLIGESTPVGHATSEGQSLWTAWHDPYFNYIATHPNIKAFSYIDTNWALSRWPTWGDSRIENNPDLISNYEQVVKSAPFLNQLPNFNDLKSALHP